MSRSRKKRSLFEEAGDGQLLDMFDVTPRMGRNTKIDLLATDDLSARSPAAFTPPPKVVVSRQDDWLEAVRQPAFPKTVEGLVAMARTRCGRIENTLAHLQAISEVTSEVGAVTVPEDVIRSTVVALVSGIEKKAEIVKHKDMVIECLGDSVSSTFERDMLLTKLNALEGEVADEAGRALVARDAVEVARATAERRRRELASVRDGWEEQAAALVQVSQAEKYAWLTASCDANEPLQARLRDARNLEAQFSIQLGPLVAGNATLGASVDSGLLAEMTRLGLEAPRAAAAKIREFVAGIDIPLETAFNPLREYKGSKAIAAARTLLGNQAKKVGA
jgi:hypothetical protein